MGVEQLKIPASPPSNRKSPTLRRTPATQAKTTDDSRTDIPPATADHGSPRLGPSPAFEFAATPRATNSSPQSSTPRSTTPATASKADILPGARARPP